MQESSPHTRIPDTPAPRLLPDELSTVYCGEDGHLYLASGDGRLTTRLTWSPDDFATLPGLPPVPGVTGELEDSHVFAHPACSADGTRIAAFGLLPTLDEELWEFEGNPWDTLEGEFPYLAEMELDEDDIGLDTEEDDVAGAGMVLVIGEEPEDEEGSLQVALAEDAETDEPPQFWPGGQVYIVHTDGVQVWAPLDLQDGSPIHLDWAPDDRHLLVLRQEEDSLLLQMVDAVEPQAPVALATGAPIFWSWQPGGRQLAMRQTPSDGGGPLVTLSDPLGDPHAPPVELAAAGTFYVPAWSPDGSALAFSTPAGREDDLVLARPHETGLTHLMSYPGRGAVRWSAASNRLAVAVAPEGQGAFEVLEVLDLASSTLQTAWQGSFIAFSWLPGDRGFLICTADESLGRLRWVTVDESGTPKPLGSTWSPTRETMVGLHFFEQMTTSHPFLSTDGRHVVYAGLADGEVLTAGPGEDPRLLPDEAPPARILVTPLDGGPTVAVGTGRFGCFAGRH